MSDRDDQPDPRRPWRTDAEWTSLRARIDADSRDSAGTHAPLPADRGRPWLRYAATGLLAASVLVAALVAYRGSRSEAPRWSTLSTPPGGRLIVRLSDSSLVVLGPGTTLRYAMSSARREVELDGVADFSVTHNAARPFVVRAGSAEATDLGTEFMVRAYAADSAVRVTVRSGVVALSTRGSQDTVTLRAGMIGVVASGGTASLAHDGDALRDGAWLSGQLVFVDQPMHDVARDIGRWFGVQVRIDDRALAGRRVTAVYSSPTLDGVLDALDATLGATHVRSGNDVLIRGARQ